MASLNPAIPFFHFTHGIPESHFTIHPPCPPRFCPRHTGKPESDHASQPSSPAVSLPPPLADRIRVAVSAAVSQLVMHEAAMRMAAMRGTGTQGEAQGMMGVFRQSAMRLLGWLDKVRHRASRHVIDRVDAIYSNAIIEALCSLSCLPLCLTSFLCFVSLHEWAHAGVSGSAHP